VRSSPSRTWRALRHSSAGLAIADLIRAKIRDVADYPKPGIVFKDITPLLADGGALAAVVAALGAGYGQVDKVAGIEARGFILAASLAKTGEPGRIAGHRGRATEMSAYVKSLAPHQLVTTGDEGFYGDATNSDYPYSNYEATAGRTSSPCRPSTTAPCTSIRRAGGESVLQAGTDPVTWGTKWITDHLTDGAALHKPVVLEEYGLAINASQGVPDEAARDAGYKAWTTRYWLMAGLETNSGYLPPAWTTVPSTLTTTATGSSGTTTRATPPTRPPRCSAHTPRR